MYIFLFLELVTCIKNYGEIRDIEKVVVKGLFFSVDAMSLSTDKCVLRLFSISHSKHMLWISKTP